MNMKLGDVKFFLLDLDGVIMKGNTPIVGAAAAVSLLRQSNAELMFTTNNSTRSRKVLKTWLKTAGIKVEFDDLITTAYCTAQYVKTQGWKRVYVIGENGLKCECMDAGITLIDEDASYCEAVIVGLDRTFTYKKLAAALSFIQKGAYFIATNTDATLPTEKTELPGAGAMVSSVIACSKREPLIIGKPNIYLLDLALERSSHRIDECCIVGDRPETDMAMAKKAGCLGILVLTGVSTKDEIDDYLSLQRPDMIFPNLLNLALQYQKNKS
jgi:4-nitrophenyl phosphatase